MTTKYYALLTSLGAARLANAAALGTSLQITHMAVGDGGGTLPTPNATQSALVGEKRRAALNSLTVDTVNSSQIIAEQVIPENEGGFWIREIGLFDADGVMIAVANCAETYKPLLQEGSGRTQTVRMILIVNSTDAVTLKIDPSVVLATRKYVDDAVIEVKAYADGLMSAHLRAADPHTQYAPKASPTLTGIPKAPTAAAGNNTTQLATTAFVQAALTALTGTAPASLDTLKELADALGNDPKFSATMQTALAGKMDIAKNGGDIADISAFLKNLGLGEGAALPVGVPVPWPVATPPDGWLKCNGSAFSAATYPKLAQAYPSLKLPDLRGEFIRGWDDGRGADADRGLLSSQGFAFQDHAHGLPTGVGVPTDMLESDIYTVFNDVPNMPSAAMSPSSSGSSWDDTSRLDKVVLYRKDLTPIGNNNGLLNGVGSFRTYRASTGASITNPSTANETRPRNVAFNYIVRAA